MQYNVILVRYGEIHLKGLNRPYFESLLKNALKRSVAHLEGARVVMGSGRYFIEDVKNEDFDAALEAVSKVFGVHSISPAVRIEKSMDAVFEAARAQMEDYLKKYGLSRVTFKVDSKRSDKRFPVRSSQISAMVGEYLLNNVEGISVDVHSPAVRVQVEIREDAYVYTDKIPGQGGMPIGSGGRAALLLSGGIDSPVAGYMISKRGVALSAVHYHSFPYTSERAKDKVISLAKIISEYTGPIKLHIVHFTDIQMSIYEKCPENMLTIIMRKYMMRIAERIAIADGAGALVTGESLGQVASQTMQSLAVTNGAVRLPVFRPLIGMDKLEIMDRARKLGTYETSILPYEDCCTVFVPKHPNTRPDPVKISEAEAVLDTGALIADALRRTEVLLVSPKGVKVLKAAASEQTEAAPEQPKEE